jgi:hypothetical protein
MWQYILCGGKFRISNQSRGDKWVTYNVTGDAVNNSMARLFRSVRGHDKPLIILATVVM